MPTWRGLVARGFFVAAIAAQLFFIGRAYVDPHKHFGFQPFNESSTWTAEIVRVKASGGRASVRKGWAGYTWSGLVRSRGLGAPHARNHADSGIGSTLAFLQHALDWVARNTPRDRETRYYEATVTYWINTRGPRQITLRSVDRPEARP